MTDDLKTTRNADGSITCQATGIRVFDLTADINSPLDGKMDDWPNIIQDGIMEALERLAQRVELPLLIIDSACKIDEGEAVDGSQDRVYVHVIASEVVVGDDRFIRDSKQEALEIAGGLLGVGETKH